MGQFSSLLDEPSGNSEASSEQNAPPMNPQSATIILLSHPIGQLVADTTSPNENWTREQDHATSSTSSPEDESPFVNTTELDLKGLNIGWSGGPFGGFGGAGSGSGLPPDSVPASFKLEAIGGLDEQIKYLKRSIILPLVKPEVLKEWGVSPPKGILLHGPPGTGKTFMAKALVNELKKNLGRNVNFFYRKGGDVFSMWFGESQRKLRQIFDTAKSMSPSVIFFDEIDGLCPSREGKNHGTEAYNSVVTCFLGQMDAIENGKVFVIAATNRVNSVDPAVRRPGRFDKHLKFNFPDQNARQKIIEIHTSKWSELDKPTEELTELLASRTMGYSGADLEKLCKDVVYTAMEENSGQITDELKITSNHWIRAIGSMQRTASDSFGSSLVIPTKPNQTISLLIKPLMDAVLKRVAPMTSERSLLHSTPTTLKSFMLYITPLQSKSFLNEQILQGILSSPLFNKWSIFELSSSKLTNKVLNNQSPTIFGAFYSVINQALDATMDGPTVVYVPNLNELLALCKANQLPESIILRTLAKVRGPKMLLLATSSVPLDEIPVTGLKDLFYDRHMQAENPKTDQLIQFFQNKMNLKKQQNPKLVGTLDEVALDAAKIADNNNFEHILSLWSALDEVQLDGDFKKRCKEMLDKFQEGRLR